MSVAELSLVPRFLRGLIRRRFVDGSKHPIILDFTGKIVGLLPFDPDNVTITVFDPQGAVIFSQSGEATDETVGKMKDAIRKHIPEVPDLQEERVSGPSIPIVQLGED